MEKNMKEYGIKPKTSSILFRWCQWLDKNVAEMIKSYGFSVLMVQEEV